MSGPTVRNANRDTQEMGGRGRMGAEPKTSKLLTAVAVTAAAFHVAGCGDTPAASVDAGTDGDVTRTETVCPTDLNVTCRWSADIVTGDEGCNAELVTSGSTDPVCNDSSGNPLDCVDNGSACTWEGGIAPPPVSTCDEEPLVFARATLDVSERVGDGEHTTSVQATMTVAIGDPVTIRVDGEDKTFTVAEVGEDCTVALDEVGGTRRILVNYDPDNAPAEATIVDGEVSTALFDQLGVAMHVLECSGVQGSGLSEDVEGNGLLLARVSHSDGRPSELVLVTDAAEGTTVSGLNILEACNGFGTICVQMTARRSTNSGTELVLSETVYDESRDVLPVYTEVRPGSVLQDDAGSEMVELVGVTDDAGVECARYEVIISVVDGNRTTTHVLEYASDATSAGSATKILVGDETVSITRAGIVTDENGDAHGLAAYRVIGPDGTTTVRSGVLMLGGRTGENTIRMSNGADMVNLEDVSRSEPLSEE